MAWLRSNRKRPFTIQNRFPKLFLETLEDRTVPTLLGKTLFPADSPWNQKIAAAPVAANSAAILNNIISKSGDGRLHPDFGQVYGTGDDLYGIPINVVHGNSVAKVNVQIDAYPDESDLSAAPIPSSVVLEGDYQNGPKVGVDERGDSHLILWDVDNNIAYEFYRASRPSENADGKWHADQQTVWDLKTNQFRTLGWTSADAAGLPILPGLVRPDEALPVSQGGLGVIDHPIRFTLRNNIILDQFQYPASHVANGGNENRAIQPPMGARFRLKSNVDISQLNPQAKIVAQAMKEYGLILADNGSNFYFSGSSYAVNGNNQRTVTWNDEDIQDFTHGLKSLRFSDFEVVDLTPIVTNLSIHAGPAGSQVTITGKNFSGSAGKLAVRFGSVAVTAATVVNDSTIVVTAPPGSGTVDVRIQSGTSISTDPDNYTGNIFGYGISEIHANTKFTYGSPPANNLPPVVLTPATGVPSIVTTKTGSLLVRANDDQGEGKLVYTWRTVSAPTNAKPIFSTNANNLAKSVNVTYNRPGTYQFQVTIADPFGQTATSMTTVVVKASYANLLVTPIRTTVFPSARVQMTAVAVDQFGMRLTAQPYVSYKLLSGPGTMKWKGIYIAPSKGPGTAVIEVKAGRLIRRVTFLIRA